MELAFVGIFVGFLSGFFGIGGGTILVPILLALGFDMKSAVGISVTQMVFSSLFGSFLNLRKGVLKIVDMPKKAKTQKAANRREDYKKEPH